MVLASALDKNLLGHFLDNELTFTNDLLNKILAKTDTNSPDVMALGKWANENGFGKNMLTKVQKEAFLGYVADIY